uniref:Uncharacterized protein n=1 Tax=Anguilla anguilla TaxID=7936 RepID=A0A0E9XHP2_ANGAN
MAAYKMHLSFMKLTNVFALTPKPRPIHSSPTTSEKILICTENLQPSLSTLKCSITN